MIGTSANILGVTLGFLLPSLFIDEYVAESDYSDAEMDKYRSQVRVMMIAFACFSFYALLQFLIFFKEKPPIPPPQNPDEKTENVEALGLC